MRTLLGGTAAALVLVAGLDATTYAATGDSLLLGKVNRADRTTEVRRTTAGPALKLTTRPGSAPLNVTSGAKVPRLNADRLDGLDGSSLQTRTRTYSDATADTIAPSSDLRWRLPLAAGRYQVEYGVGLGPADPARVECSVSSQVGTGATTRVAFAIDRGAEGDDLYLHGSDVLTVRAGATTYFQCVGGAVPLSVLTGMTPRVNVTRIDVLTTATLPRANF